MAYKKKREISLSLCKLTQEKSCEETAKKVGIYKLGREVSPEARPAASLILSFLVRKFCCFCHPASSIMLWCPSGLRQYEKKTNEKHYLNLSNLHKNLLNRSKMCLEKIK